MIPEVQPLRDADRARFTQRAQAVPAEVTRRAAAIVEDVRQGGDGALRRWTRELDGADLADPFVPRADWLAGVRKVPAGVRRAIDENLARIRAFHKLQAGR
jgi:histidinol dehydrogenase